MEVATNKAAPREQREAALAALTALNAGRNAGVLGRVLTDADAAVELREATAKLLAQANQPETQAQLLAALPSAPARLQTAIAAGLAGSPAGAAKLLDAVEAGKASARLLQEKAVETPLTTSTIAGGERSPGEADEGAAAGRPEDPGADRRPPQGLRRRQARRRPRRQGV